MARRKRDHKVFCHGCRYTRTGKLLVWKVYPDAVKNIGVCPLCGRDLLYEFADKTVYARQDLPVYFCKEMGKKGVQYGVFMPRDQLARKLNHINPRHKGHRKDPFLRRALHAIETGNAIEVKNKDVLHRLRKAHNQNY